MATDVETLQISLEASLTKLQRQMASAGLIVDRETKKAATSASRNLKAMEDQAARSAANVSRSLEKAGQGGSRFGTQIQNFGFQIGDAAVQIAGGTSAIRALAQQLPQLLGGFGAVGAVAGAAVAVLGAVVGQLNLFGGTATLSADQLNKLNDALDTNKEATAAAAQGYDALIAKIANFTEIQKAAFIVQQQTTLQAQLKDLEQAIATASESIQTNVSDIRGQMRAMFNDDLQDPGLLLLGKRFQELREQLASGKLPVEGYLELRDILSQISASAGPELQKTIQGISNELIIAGAKADDYSQKQKVTQAVIDTVNGVLKASNQYLIDQAAGLGQAAAAADGYAKSMRDAGAAQLSFGVRSSRAGFAQIPRETGPLAGLPVDPTGRGFLEQSADEKAFYESMADLEKKGRGGSRKAKEAKDPQLEKYLAQLKNEVTALGLVGIALKENELLTQAAAKAKEDYKNKLRDSANLTAAETEQIKAQARVLVGVPDILKLAKENLPDVALADQLKQFTEMQGLLKNPEVMKALEAQGVSADQAGKAIEYAMDKARDSAYGTSQAIASIGDALNSGIQNAQSFSEALQKVGFSLLNLLAQASVGQGPLGKLANNLLGVGAGGLLGLLGGGGSVAGAVSGAASGIPGGGYTFAAGGNAGPGPVLVGENGPEILSLSRRGHVTPANATRRVLSGSGSGAQPITFNISLAGANGDRAIAQIAAAAVKKGLASVPEINRQHRIRFA